MIVLAIPVPIRLLSLVALAFLVYAGYAFFFETDEQRATRAEISRTQIEARLEQQRVEFEQRQIRMRREGELLQSVSQIEPLGDRVRAMKARLAKVSAELVTPRAKEYQAVRENLSREEAMLLKNITSEERQIEERQARIMQLRSQLNR